jgi:VanZ family protein
MVEIRITTSQKRKILFVWIALTIFPVVALGRISPGFMRAFNAVFRPNWMHVIMHMLLFAGLVLLLCLTFGWKPGWRVMAVAVVAILVVAVLQEGLQALGQGFFPLKGALYDLGVDFLGGAVGYGIYFNLIRYQYKRLTAK